MRRILITGGTGQLGIELLRRDWPSDIELIAPPSKELNLTDRESIRAAILRQSIDCVINTAAFTAVDAAEHDEGSAFLVNCQGPQWLAEAAEKEDIPLIHISTDYVFSGDADRPYREEDSICPLNAYGASKAAGERAVHSVHPCAIILRTSWVLSAHRSNFLKSMLQLAVERPCVTVAADQRGSPTAAADLAEAIAKISLHQIDQNGARAGLYHFANSGEASWYELATEIFRLSAEQGGPSAEVRSISTIDYASAARRPANSRLATGKITRDFGIIPRSWQVAVADIIAELETTGQLKRMVR